MFGSKDVPKLNGLVLGEPLRRPKFVQESNHCQDNKMDNEETEVHVVSDDEVALSSSTQSSAVEIENEVDESTIEFLKNGLYAECEFAFTGDDNITLHNPIGVAQLRSGKIVVADTFDDRLLLFSDGGEFISEFGNGTALKQPSAIVVLPDGSFGVRSNYKICVFDPNCVPICTIAKNTLKKPFGITHDENGNLVTVETGLDVIMIVVIDPSDGQVINRIPITGAVDPSERGNTKPRFITFRPPNILLIVDLGLDRLYFVDINSGQTLKTRGGTGNGNGEFKDPSGITCDPDGYILIGDSRNHRIQIFSPLGDFVTVLKVERPLRRPSGICLTPSGHLLVLNYWEQSLVKYKLVNRSGMLQV